MQQVLQVLFPIFGLILAGYFAAKTGKLSKNATTEINRFVVWLALPAQLFEFTSKPGWQAHLNFGFVIAFSVGAFIVYFALLLWHKYRSNSWKDASFYSLTGSYANTGYVGIPLCVLALGQEGMAPSVIGCLIMVCVLFGVAIIFVEIGQQSHQAVHRLCWVVLKSLATNPLLVAPLLGVLVSTTELDLYGPAHQFLAYLGAAASPCALVSIGLFLYQKQQEPSQEISSTKDAWLLSVIKLIVQPLIVWIIAGPIMHLPNFWLSAAVLLSALPTGTGPFMLAQYYHVEGSLISKVVLYTTVGSVFTLSVLLWILPI